MEQRGKMKTPENYIPFHFDGQLYVKYFSQPESVRRDLGRLFQLWNQLPESSNGDIFAKFIILQIELISIHPFTDGNGRVARAFSESYLESKGVFTIHSLFNRS